MRAKSCGGVGLVKQDVASNNGIECFRVAELIYLRRLETDAFGSSHPGFLDRYRVAVNPEDAAGRAHDFRRQERHVAHPAADIQHSHSSRNARSAKEGFGKISNDLGLLNETLLLDFRLPEHILRRGFRGRHTQISVAAEYHVASLARGMYHGA